jgi:hypothetical protein
MTGHNTMMTATMIDHTNSVPITTIPRHKQHPTLALLAIFYDLGPLLSWKQSEMVHLLLLLCER